MRVLALVLLLACSKDDGTGRGGASGELTRDTLIATWKKAGLTPSPMTAATVAVGKDCQTGTVNGVDVLVCQFATVEEAKAAEPKGLEWIGESPSGFSQATGKVLVAASDKRKADPTGRSINQIQKLSK